MQPNESGDSNCTTIMHNNKMPPGGDNGVTNSGPLNEMPPNGDSGVTNSGKLNEMPPDGILLAAEPCAGGAPPDGAYLVRLANKDQVNITEDGDTLHKVAT